jgi:Protein of unknown function (DUF559)
MAGLDTGICHQDNGASNTSQSAKGLQGRSSNPSIMTVLEMDGTSHRPRQRHELDRKKTEVLRALGWMVIRINH